MRSKNGIKMLLRMVLDLGFQSPLAPIALKVWTGGEEEQEEAILQKIYLLHDPISRSFFECFLFRLALRK